MKSSTLTWQYLLSVYWPSRPTSVPSEIIFPTFGDVVNAQGACLSPENVNIAALDKVWTAIEKVCLSRHFSFTSSWILIILLTFYCEQVLSKIVPSSCARSSQADISHFVNFNHWFLETAVKSVQQILFWVYNTTIVLCYWCYWFSC